MRKEIRRRDGLAVIRRLREVSMRLAQRDALDARLRLDEAGKAEQRESRRLESALAEWERALSTQTFDPQHVAAFAGSASRQSGVLAQSQARVAEEAVRHGAARMRHSIASAELRHVGDLLQKATAQVARTREERLLVEREDEHTRKVWKR